MDQLYILLIPIGLVMLILLAGPDSWLERLTRPWRKS
jgi:hypothetical protein